MRFAALLLVLGACGGKGEAKPPPDNHADPAAGGAIELRAEAVAGGHAAVVHNGTAATIRLHRELRVERQAGATWALVDASGLYLRDHCDVPNGGLFEPPTRRGSTARRS